MLVRAVDPGYGLDTHNADLVPEGPHVTQISLPEGGNWEVAAAAQLDLEGGIGVAAFEGLE